MGADLENLFRFPGGLRLEPNKASATERPLADMPLPSRLVVAVDQHMGSPCFPVVEAGQRVLRGEVIADTDAGFAAPVHAPTSGTVVAIEDRVVPHPSGMSARCILIDADGEDRWHPDVRPVDQPAELSAEALRERIRRAGIVGMGGAAFPTWIKLHRDPDAGLDCLVLNGAECEPYISCDDTLMRHQPERVLAGTRLMMRALGTERCVIAVEEDKRPAQDALRTALEALGDDRIEVVEVPAVYPEGGERQLIQVITGKEVPSGGLPLDIGLVCQNVATAAAVADAILDGRPSDSRIVTVTGAAVAEPRNLRVRIGTRISEVIEAAGGYWVEPEMLIMGGPMMGFTLPSDRVPVVKATNCLLAAGPGELAGSQTPMPCIRCGDCASVCPASLLPQQLYWYARARDLEQAEAHDLMDCIECGCCDVVCPSHIPLVEYFRFAKSEIWNSEKERQRSEQARRRFDARKQRLEAQERERAERLERRKRKLARDSDEQGSEIDAVLDRARQKREGDEDAEDGA